MQTPCHMMFCHRFGNVVLALPYSHLVFGLFCHVQEFEICIWSSGTGHAGSTIPGRNDVIFVSKRFLLLVSTVQKAVSKETGAFISFDDVIKPHFGYYDVTFLQSDWLKRAQGCHLAGISCFSHAFEYKKVNLAPGFKERGCPF